ncbi:hypothetical protein D9611_001660 [Ephemerocybe angulata]|uniref:Arrestin-like N-terminal domain-containing protein n=1 Tax=Ephemerocybe angulata TaxID=980116 RepID=A0A8H5CJT1_9AGAR|nr:hypothetical protein D9611_001660 [Tulosesus angulatus]
MAEPVAEEHLPSYQASQTASPRSTITAAHANLNTLSTEHQSTLVDSSGKNKWLSLTVTTRPRKPQSLPQYWEGDIIKGQVELDLREGKTENAKRLSISVIGGTTLVGQPESIFLNDAQTLWTPSPTSPKLQGKQTWPFEITLPKQVDIKGSKYNLPPTFTVRGSPVHVDYKLVVQVKRGFFKSNAELMTTFGYLVSTVAEPPSALRQTAYREVSAVLGPEVDPEGWKILEPVKTTGSLFGQSGSVEIEVTLTYALGSPVPLRLTLKSTNTTALDLLATPKSIRLEIVRSMITGPDAASNDTASLKSENVASENEGFAFWWDTPRTTDSGPPRDPNERVLWGELEIPLTLKPTFCFHQFSLRYSLILQPLTATGWHTASDSKQKKLKPLLSEWVTIVSKPTPGMPKARSDAPPGYDRTQQTNFLKSVGGRGGSGFCVASR